MPKVFTTYIKIHYIIRGQEDCINQQNKVWEYDVCFLEKKFCSVLRIDSVINAAEILFLLFELHDVLRTCQLKVTEFLILDILVLICICYLVSSLLGPRSELSLYQRLPKFVTSKMVLLSIRLLT